MIENRTSRGPSCQEPILRYLQTEQVPVYIFLKSGIKIQGVIAGFDAHVIILESANIHQMIFKHAISTVLPQKG